MKQEIAQLVYKKQCLRKEKRTIIKSTEREEDETEQVEKVVNQTEFKERQER